MNEETALNKRQRQAVTAPAGPLLIVAGPGTGKTKTLVSKIVYLIKNQGVPPDKIVALTFTQKAASEMKERVGQALPDQTAPPFIGTFHALAHEIVSRQQGMVRLISEEEQKTLIKRLRQNGAELRQQTTRQLLLLLTRAKSTFPIQELPVSGFKHFLSLYTEALREVGKLDYDDLLQNAYEILRRQPDAWVRSKALLVDEFQDTNDIQYQLLRALQPVDDNICVIGDPDQAIYSFRGATSNSFLRFAKDFPQGAVIELDQNYRSGQAIIDASGRFFPGRKRLQANQTDLGQVTIVTTVDERTEAEWISRCINDQIGGLDLNAVGIQENNELGFSDFAIIYRTHQVGRQLARHLAASGIPYQVIGGHSLYEQPDIARVVAVLRWLEKKDVPEAELVQNVIMPSVKKGVLPELAQLRSQADGRSVSQLIEDITRIFGIVTDDQTNPDVTMRWQTLRSSVVHFDNQENGLSAFCAHVRYLETHEYYNDQSDQVTLLTMHAAKGLEFPHVFVAGFTEGFIPLETATDIEEEKRLLYVAMTRAERALYLIETKRRHNQKARPSRFKALLGDEIQRVEDKAIVSWHKRQAQRQEQKRQLALL